MPTPRIPLAWKNLSQNRVRMALFSAGIGFAVVLMFVQLGCYNALMDSSVLVLRQLNRVDLVLVSTQQQTILLRNTFSRSELARARGVPGVGEVYPLYIEYGLGQLRDTHQNPDDRAYPTQAIRVLGVDPDAHLFKFPALDPRSPDSKIEQLRLDGNVLFDRRSKRGPKPGDTLYGPVDVGTTSDLAGYRVTVVGLFDLGTDFGADGTLITSTDTFGRILRSGPPIFGLDAVDVGLVRLTPGADLAKVQKELKDVFADDQLDVMTLPEFIAHEKAFWRKSTPAGKVFSLGVILGAVVGAVICFQILSSDIRDNLGAYATLRAIGYPNRYLLLVVLEEAVILAVLGFGPGVLVSLVVYEGLHYLTNLPLTMTPGLAAGVFGCTVVVCLVSGWLAARQATTLDPAEVF